MGDPIEDYIRAYRELAPREDLTRQLLAAGHDRAAIEAAFSRVNQATQWSAPAPRRSKFNPVALILIIGAVALAGVLFRPHASSDNDTNTTIRTPVPDANWQPAGYTVWPSDTSIAFRFQGAGEYTCSFGGCKGMEFVARDGCPNSLYVELSLLDATGASVGFTNDVSGTLAAGQHAKLVFSVLEESTKKVQVTEVNCF